MDSIWQALPRPFFALAPMANITDAAFRRVVTRVGKADILWTEFVSADGLQSRGKEKLLIDFLYSEEERPIIAQLFSGKPENIERSAVLCAELGFDGVDINMGCPDKTVEKQSAGAALIKNPSLALELIAAAKQGATSASRRIPVSVKTRTGYNTHITEEWIQLLLSAHPVAITIHARTRKEMSKVPARWEEIAKAVQLAKNSGVLIIGNGDVKTVAEGRARAQETGCDGIMIGRGAIGNPWVFAERTPDVRERFTVMRQHVSAFRQLLSAHKNFTEMRKHLAAYVKGLPGAAELRVELLNAETLDGIDTILTREIDKNSY